MVIVHDKYRRAVRAAHARHTLYALNFIFSLHTALVAYYLSTFLVARGFSQEFVGLLYAFGSVLTLLSLTFAPQLLQRFGNYTNMLALGLMELLAFIGFIILDNRLLLLVVFLITFIIPTLIAFSLDIFLEGATKTERVTSGVRGIFLSISSAAWVGAPFVGGLIAEGDNYTLLFTTAALIFVPFIFLAASQLEHFRDPRYVQLHIASLLKTLTGNVDLRGVFIASFLLRFFSGIMVVYFPLYLHGTLGMPLSDVGIIIAFAITAFVLLEVPLGKLADQYWGEKEIMTIGLAILAIATGVFSLLGTTSVLVWALIAFISRVGAAMVEVTTEGYFFKHVDARDTDEVSAFRMLLPLAYIVSPLFGTAVLLFFPLQFIFIATGGILMLGIVPVAHLKDTK